jgi:hypothetical protein
VTSGHLPPPQLSPSGAAGPTLSQIFEMIPHEGIVIINFGVYRTDLPQCRVNKLKTWVVSCCPAVSGIRLVGCQSTSLTANVGLKRKPSCLFNPQIPTVDVSEVALRMLRNVVYLKSRNYRGNKFSQNLFLQELIFVIGAFKDFTGTNLRKFQDL